MRLLEEIVTEPEAQRNTRGSAGDEAAHGFETLSHDGTQLMADDSVFEPGPSFVEIERPSDRLTEMPAWLQTFAAGEDTADETSNEVQETVPEPDAQPAQLSPQVEPDATLPEWLRVDPGHPEPVAQVDTLGDFDTFQEPVENGASTFISEDDFPDWLRAFSNETPAAPALRSPGSTRAAAPNPAAAGSTMVRVPPVENVWLSGYERQALGPGRTLFALLASNSGTATFSEANVANEPSYSNDTTSARNREAPASVAHGSGSAVAEGAVGQPRNSTRLLLLSLIVVLLLVFVSFTLL